MPGLQEALTLSDESTEVYDILHINDWKRYNRWFHRFLTNLQLTGEIPNEIGKMSNLEILYTTLRISIHEWINFTTKRNLRNNQLTGEIPDGITKLTNLKILCVI